MIPAEHEAGIRKALANGGGTHGFEDVLQQIADGDAQLWLEQDAVIVTEIHQTPRKRVLHFWLATGELEAVIRLSDKAEGWGRSMGCTLSTIAGRKGWEKVLQKRGWFPMLTLMGKEL